MLENLLNEKYEFRPPKEGVDLIRRTSAPNGKVKSGIDVRGGLDLN